ncbi:MAG: LamG-like jellyroll fold domain-containing protein [Verrucomicrobiia bacterium]
MTTSSFGIVASILVVCVLLPATGLAAPAAPEPVATDVGGGTLPGISHFELYGAGLYWWKTDALTDETVRREGTLVVRPTLGLARLILDGSPNRYLGKGYNFRIGGATRDDLFVYYTANGYLRKKPLASSAADALNDDNRVTSQLFIPPFQLETVPVAADGAVMLHKGELWYADWQGGRFSIRSATSQVASALPFSAAGGKVKRMVVTEVLSESGSRLKDVLVVLTTNGLLYQFDFDPDAGTVLLLARNVRDFGIRHESVTSLGPGGISFTQVYSTIIYAAAPDLAPNRPTGRLYRISARDGSNSVEYDTQSTEQQVTAVAVDNDRLYITVTPVACGGLIGCLFDQANSQILSRFAPANSELILPRRFSTIVDRTTVGGPVEGEGLRSDARWLYWISGNQIWRITSNAEAIERDFEAVGLEAVQTTQDLDNSTRLVANKPTVVRAYARVTKDTTGRNRYTPTAWLRGFLDNQELPGSPLAPVSTPAITQAGDFAVLRGTLANCFLFELPAEWVRGGRLRFEFTVNPRLGVPETGPAPLANNTTASTALEVIPMGSPCLVFVPIHTTAPDYDPRAPNSDFAGILARAQSLLPVDRFRFVIKGDRISKPAPKIKFKDVLGIPVPYPAIDYEAFDVSDGFSAALFWLMVYSTFEKDPANCDDAHYVGAVHWMANTTKNNSTALGLATRPDSGVAGDLVVKMQPAGSVAGNSAWMEPPGGETLAHELSHNYTLRHIDQTTSPLMCGGGRPDNAGSYPADTCTIGIVNAAAVTAELSDRRTQYGFDPLTWSVIGPTNAADIMTYRSSKWLSKPTLDLLFGRIPGRAAPAGLRLAAQQAALPEKVILVTGTLNRALHTAALWQCFRLPTSTFDEAKVRASIFGGPVEHDWQIRFLDAAGEVLKEHPLRWERTEDGDDSRSSFAQFVPDEPNVRRLEILKGQTVVAECVPSPQAPQVGVENVRIDPDGQRLSVAWSGTDADQDSLSYTLQYSPDDGITWLTLRVGYPDESFDTSTHHLSGGDQCRLRIIASDGFHSVIAQTDPFQLRRHAPEVFMTGVSEGQRLRPDPATFLNATAYDVEEGSLDPAGLRWQLSGPVQQNGVGSTFSLRDLSPGSYELNTSITDIDKQIGSTTVRFHILPLEVPESSVPEFDGECDDEAYHVAPVIRISLGDGQFASARIIHAADALYACVSDLKYSSNGQPQASIGIRTDRNAGKTDGSAADPMGFFVDESGIPFQAVANQLVTPQVGFSALVSRGESSWSAELRISDPVLGGWNRQAPILIAHAFFENDTKVSVWPAQAKLDEPATWSDASLGKLPTLPNRAPVAIAGPSRVLTVGQGETVFLDGGNSYDPDASTLKFAWTQIDGRAIDLDDSSRATPSFRVPSIESETVLTLQLIVSDAELDSQPAFTTVTLALAKEAPASAKPISSAVFEPSKAGLTFHLFWPGDPGDRCVIQASSNLVAWEDLRSANADSRNLVTFTLPLGNARDHLFFRALAAEPPLAPAPRAALRFDGSSGFAAVAHRSALNPFPLTAMAWVRTEQNKPQGDGVLSKYTESSLNGYSLFLYDGRLRGWYFRDGQNFIWDGNLGMDGGFIADGQWHHVALVVDEAGGRLLVDGLQTAQSPWVGSPGATTSTTWLQMGRYDQYTNAWLGDLDEIQIWQTALTTNQVRQASSTRNPVPALEGLVGLWHFDESEGVSSRDDGFHGFTAALLGGFEWIPSDVPLQ